MAGTQQIQAVSNIYQQQGWVGDCARPEEPTLYDYQSASGSALKPGYGAWYDRSTNTWKVPTNVAGQLDVTGFVSFDPATVAQKLTNTPTNSNSRQNVEIPSGEPVKVGLMGAFWAIAGETVEPGDFVWFDHDDNNWQRFSLPQGGTYPASPAAGDLFQFNVGASNLSNTVDINGTSALNNARGGDVFRRTGTNWVKQLHTQSLPKKSIYALTKAAANGIVILRFTPAIAW